MKYYGKKSLSSCINIILSMTLLLGVVLTIITYYRTFTKNDMFNFKGIIYLLLLTTGIISTFAIVLELKKISKTLVLENPFTWDNVSSLKKLSNCCFIISCTYIINFIFSLSSTTFKVIYIDRTGIHTDAEVFIFLLAGCFIKILSKVFQQAVKYKEDNDLTI